MSDGPSRDAIALDARDNVATVLRALGVGEQARVETPSGVVALQVLEPVPLCHKIALRPIPAGEAIVKYGAPIGRACADVEAGRHVHVHNLKSQRDRSSRASRP